ncbi:MAG: hypothetical protein IJ001_10600 [Oscillospiraceae bacterium]|nr:hypothetical protein [Oscillospiraceae bacterium]
MGKYFHGENKRGPYFEGWYFKCQTRDGKSLALIPAIHIDENGRRSASVQVIADSGSWWLEFPGTEFHAAADRLHIQIADNLFSAEGLFLNIDRDGISLHGHLKSGAFLPLRSDIMGPFRFLGNMECAHGVVSMAHPLHGVLVLNETVLDFDGGTGYIETDRGRSFPCAYLWTQCFLPQGGLMLSVAAIPLGGLRFTGCICAIAYSGREYRLATYRGVKIESWSACGARITQGKYRLEVELLEQQAHPLRAPAGGAMTRTIHESICAKMRYRFWIGEKLLFEHTDPRGSFEYARF